MFNDLDKSPFDDSTGLKFVEYLTRKADANQRVPRSRKQLFRLAEVDGTADEFTIRNIVEKENTAVETRASAQSVKKTQTPTAARQERSSLFTPFCASTPMVPTTVHTPYRASRKSIGTQKSPLEVPLSQQPEVPETPEVVVPQRVPAAAGPTIIILAQDILAPPTPFAEKKRIYPDLENFGQQQEALPTVVIPAPVETVVSQPAPKETCAAAAPPMVVIHQHAPVNSPPPPPPPAKVPEPAASAPVTSTPTRRLISVISPERLMEIIHAPAAVVNDEASVVIQETEPMSQSPESVPQSQHVKTPRRLVQRMGPDTPRPNPDTPAVVLPPLATPAETPRQFDDSSFFAVPTPVVKSFKLVMNDCMKNESAAVDQTQTRRSSVREPRQASTQSRTGPSTTAGKNKIVRASELTIPKGDSRHSFVVPSTQKRKLHSLARELTPIRSPLPGSSCRTELTACDIEQDPVAFPEHTLVVSPTQDDRCGEEAEVQSETQQPSQPRNSTKAVVEPAKRPRGRPKKTDCDTVFKVPAEKPKRRTKTAAPKSKKKLTDTATPSEEKSTTKSSGSGIASSSDDSSKAQEERPKKRATAGPKSEKQRPSSVVIDNRQSEVEAMLSEWTGEPESATGTTTADPGEVGERVREADNNPAAVVVTAEEPPMSAKKDDSAIFKMPALPVQRKKRTTIAAKQAPIATDRQADGTRRSGRAAKPKSELLPYYMIDQLSAQNKQSVNYNPQFEDFCASMKAKIKPGAKKREEVLENDRSTATQDNKSSSNRPLEQKRTKTTTKAAPKKQKRATNDEAFDALREPPALPTTKAASKKQKKARNDEPLQEPPALPVVPEEPDVSMIVTYTPRTTRPREEKRRLVSRTRMTSGGNGHSLTSTSVSTFRDHFSGNMQPSCSTGVDWSTSQSAAMVTITRTLNMDSFDDLGEERVRHQEFDGGKMMTYADYSKGIIVLSTKKQRARVKRKPLVLNMVSGTIILNLESEKRVVRVTELDEISIPVGMWYSLENIGNKDAVLMFTWT